MQTDDQLSSEQINHIITTENSFLHIKQSITISFYLNFLTIKLLNDREKDSFINMQ